MESSRHGLGHGAAEDSPARRFADVRATTRALAEPLSAEDCALQSMPDASPVKWHLAHTTWFFETFLLAPHLPGHRPFHPQFRVLFNSYYNGVGDRHPRPERGMLSRPGLDEVLRYRAAVEDGVRTLLARHEPALDPLIELGIQHEQQHQELILTDVKHLLSRNPLRPEYRKPWPLTPVHARQRTWIGHAGRLREIGHRGDGFAFDNELPRHRVFVPAFELASHPVTNGDWLEFIADDGYRRPELWLSLGWDAVRANCWQAPHYWLSQDGGWRTFTLHGLADVDPHAPVCHVSYFEADAFARWAGARLPTEFEWETAATALLDARHAGPANGGNFLESGVFHPLAPRGSSRRGEPAQLFGDVWEWTQSAYAPYPGFRTAPGAIGEYNGKFMCNQYVLRGGSCATPKSHIRATYRNFFPPEARWQFSGVRLARDA
jgi:ergothioneine biosynthesis protein EgtB